ncbi:MAG: hypothetical protein R3F56_02075 [Planctomycetota bacterium]
MRALVLALGAFVCLAPAQQLVRDINTFTDNPGSHPGPFVTFGTAVVFAATTASSGRELWLLPDGSTQALLIADLAPGPADADPGHLVVAGGRLFFAATDGRTPGLYASDGTPTGTVRLASVRLQPPGERPQLVAVGSAVFAVADDGTRGPELWYSDGSVAGTRLVREFEPGASGVELLAAAANGRELYCGLATPRGAPTRVLLVRSDGTASGTMVVTRSDQGGPLVGDAMVASNGVVYFSGSPPGQDDYELWRSDGTPGGTRLVVDLDASGGSFLGGLTPYGSGVTFLAHAGAYGDEPIVSDGTAFGTQIVDVNVLVGRGSQPAHLTVLGSDLFLMASSPQGRGLFRVDGSSLVASMVLPLEWRAQAPRDMVASGARLFLLALDAAAQARTAGQLWVSDGTTAGTTALRDLRQGLGDPRFEHLHAHGVGVVFAADDGLLGSEPWRSDGTPAGTGPAADVHTAAPVRGLGSDPTFFVHTGGLSVFDADDGDRGREPWVTDATSARTQRLDDLVPGADGSVLAALGVTGAGVLVASTRDVAGVPSASYWVSDGRAGNAMALGWPAPLGPPLPGTVAADGDRAVLFAAAERAATGGGNVGYWLLRSDGTSLQEVLPRFGGAPRAVHVVGSTVFFAAPGVGGGYEPWTPAGRILDLRPGAGGSDPGATLGIGLGRHYLFSADDGVSGNELWRSDGTASGTVLLADLASGSAASDPRSGVVSDGVLHFVADVSGVGAELCRSDGTAAGTFLVADVRPGPLGSQPLDLVVQHGGVYFTADDGTNGRRLWFSDGTAAGTRLVSLLPNQPRALAALGARRVLLVGEDTAEGDEAWISDGTASGTRRLAPVRPGPAGSGIVRFDVRPDGRALFVADDGVHGREPWLYDGGATAVSIGASCGVEATRLSATDPVLGANLTFDGRVGVVANFLGVLVLSAPADDLFGACRVYVDPTQLALPFTTTTGTFQVSMPLPNAPRLIARLLHAQAAIGPFTAPPGWSLSNAVVLRIGR